MQYVKIAKVADFDGVRVRTFKILARTVGVVKDPDGTFYAIEFDCKHQNANLGTGQIRGDVVTCPRHGWTYNIRSGVCLNQRSAPLRRYALKIEDEDIYVSLRPTQDDGCCS
jgi:nitrite reductase/ring-hydroxylating ferredoxin subunit